VEKITNRMILTLYFTVERLPEQNKAHCWVRRLGYASAQGGG